MRKLLFIIFIWAGSFTVQAEETLTFKKFSEQNEVFVKALKLSEKSNVEAREKIEKWNPENNYIQIYKDFWKAIWSPDFSEAKSMYENLKKQKKFLRLRIDLMRKLYEQTPVVHTEFLQKESKLLLNQLRGTSEGEIFEADFLRWLQNHKYFDVICKSERSRWISEPEVNFVEMYAAIEKCPMDFEDFLMRLRRLIFAAKEYQAQREIEQFIKASEERLKLQPWQKAYLQAIYDSNVGDPVKAFKNLSEFEKDILESDYDDNYFYIAQRAGELKKAEEIIKKVIARAAPKDKKELTFQQGFLFYQTKQYATAHKIFNDLYKQHPAKNKKRKSKDFDQLAWLRAWVLFLDQKYDQSLKAFEETKSFASDTARLNYWIAVNQMKLQNTQEALQTFRKLSESLTDQKSYSFYSLLAWIRYEDYRSQFKNSDLIKSLILQTKSTFTNYPSPDDKMTRSQLMQHYNELADESFVTDEGDIQVVNTENEVMDSAELQGLDVGSEKDLTLQLFWAQLLIDQGKSDFAKWHIFELEKNIKDRKKGDILTKFYLEKEFYYRALSLQNRLGTPKQTITQLKSDPMYWSSLYPEAYKKYVQQFANNRKVDPFLIWSIMKAETQYKSDAISPVGAVGLMQFMPYTLQKIDRLIGGKEVKTEELFKPEKSIEYGAAYLKKLSIELDYQRPLIAAAYNGGPHRVKQWLRNMGQLEYDVFIEHIPFAETRTYTKRVITFRSMYDKIYGGQLNYDKMKFLIEKIPYTAPESAKLSEEWDFQLK